MSCNGCRVLRKGCSDRCILRPCLQWIECPQAQGNATLFLSKFFGRSDLMAFVASVPESKRSALFQSLLFEACGRTVNPVNGAVGLLSTGNWNICKEAVATVLAGGVLRPVNAEEVAARAARACAWESGRGGSVGAPHQASSSYMPIMHGPSGIVFNDVSRIAESNVSEASPGGKGSNKEPKLLNLFPEN